MDLITSVFTICGTVSESDRQYRILARKLCYEVKKAEHLLQTQKVKYVPKFIIQNLTNKVNEGKVHLQKIQSILTQDRISFKQKIKLSLPFNKTNLQVKTALQQLEKAQQDVNQYGGSTQFEYNGKRSMDDLSKMEKKQQRILLNIPEDEVNDEDVDQAIMGPTIQQDAAIQFTRNKYIVLRVELHGSEEIIKIITEANPDLLVYKSKIQIKSCSNYKKAVEELQLFSLGRYYFKPVYSLLRPLYADIDRISKQNHFVIKLRRKRENMKNHGHVQLWEQKAQNNHTQVQSNHKVQNDQFFSFPCTEQPIVTNEVDTIIVERGPQKNVYISDATGAWQKMRELQKQLCKGQEIAAYIPPNRKPQVPDLIFKVHFEILQ